MRLYGDVKTYNAQFCRFERVFNWGLKKSYLQTQNGFDYGCPGLQSMGWLSHLIGDIHPPVHAVTLFSREYPKGDEGGTETCVRVAQGRAALSLHQLWDELLTSSNKHADPKKHGN